MNENNIGSDNQTTAAEANSKLVTINLIERIIKLETALSFAKGIVAASGITVAVILGGIIFLLTQADSIDHNLRDRQDDTGKLFSQLASLKTDFEALRGDLPALAAKAVSFAVDDSEGSFQRGIIDIKRYTDIVMIPQHAICPEPAWTKVTALWWVSKSDADKIKKIVGEDHIDTTAAARSLGVEYVLVSHALCFRP